MFDLSQGQFILCEFLALLVVGEPHAMLRASLGPSYHLHAI